MNQDTTDVLRAVIGCVGEPRFADIDATDLVRAMLGAVYLVGLAAQLSVHEIDAIHLQLRLLSSDLLPQLQQALQPQRAPN